MDKAAGAKAANGSKNSSSSSRGRGSNASGRGNNSNNRSKAVTNETRSTAGAGAARNSHSRNDHSSAANTNINNNSNGGAAHTNEPYPPHWSMEECLSRYHQTSSSSHENDSNRPSTENSTSNKVIIRGKLRVLPGTNKCAFVACDRGSLRHDVLISDAYHRNRALDGDLVFVELLNDEDIDNDNTVDRVPVAKLTMAAETKRMGTLSLSESLLQKSGRGGEAAWTTATVPTALSITKAATGTTANQDGEEHEKQEQQFPLWQDDEIQMDLWNPIVPIKRPPLQQPVASNKTTAGSTAVATAPKDSAATANNDQPEQGQRRGRVVHVLYPKSIYRATELKPDATPSNHTAAPPSRRIVGSLLELKSGTVLFTPNNRSLPQFKCFAETVTKALIQAVLQAEDERAANHKNNTADDGTGDNASSPRTLDQLLFQAEYVYGSWKESHKNWPPAHNVQFLGSSCILQDEIQSLLLENDVDHGDFPSDVLKDVDNAVQSGLYVQNNNTDSEDLGWKPTPEMYVGRRDYRHQRIFTIDPTTAKDLDDALHITQLDDGLIEIGVHIADVSYFVQPDSAVNDEAVRRATTVYLVDRSIPMLPRPLCEVACSLNENVERLAFSCVWKMKANGALRIRKKSEAVGGTASAADNENANRVEDVWFGRTVIKSCARLDYATAQNIIENKVAAVADGKDLNDDAVDESLWPVSRRPMPGGPHTLAQVAADVRLMHKVAMARRQLRFMHGALALHSVKLTFALDADGQSPLLAAPYPIRDSNRLVEEYMLLANYLVAQRLITHAKDLACLRRHPPPKMESMDKVAVVAKAALNFDIDVTSSQTVHQSLVKLGARCREINDPLVLTCVTQMLTLPMQQAQYFAAGTLPSESWCHFALNMPYYTHFTSPIRRFPDVIVHRLLQASLDQENASSSIARADGQTEDTLDFGLTVSQLQQVCEHCSAKQMASKEAQQRCDRVYLSLYLKKHVQTAQLGIVLSVGLKSFTVFLPTLGADAMLYLDEHTDILSYEMMESNNGMRRLRLKAKALSTSTTAPANNQSRHNISTALRRQQWSPKLERGESDELDIKVFTKLFVSVGCKEKAPIDIQVRLEGPYRE